MSQIEVDYVKLRLLIRTVFPELNISIVYIQFRLDDVVYSIDAVEIMIVFNKSGVRVYIVCM